MLKIERIDEGVDKDIIVYDSNDHYSFRMRVDYDDVDHDAVRKRIKKIVKLCNEHTI